MSTGPGLAQLDLEAFAERLAQRTPTPGGGSVAAYLVALGSALLTMAFRFTSGPKHAAVEAAMAERTRALEGIRARALELVDLDSAAYDRVTAAYGLPKGDEREKAARAARIQEAIRGAMGVPMETMRAAVQALGVAVEGCPAINRNLASDAATGSWCLWSAVESAALNVRINAASLADRELAGRELAECERTRARAAELAEAARRSAAGHLA